MAQGLRLWHGRCDTHCREDGNATRSIRRGIADEHGGGRNGDGFDGWAACRVCRISLAAGPSTRPGGPLIKVSPVCVTVSARNRPAA